MRVLSSLLHPKPLQFCFYCFIHFISMLRFLWGKQLHCQNSRKPLTHVNISFFIFMIITKKYNLSKFFSEVLVGHNALYSYLFGNTLKLF